jgi:SpoVK/Ycf46/Vps4 family AAA+-type ATPase
VVYFPVPAYLTNLRSKLNTSALARYIYCYLDRELIVKPAGDILSKYVGGSEKNLTKVFVGAESADAVLVIDEDDSLLFGHDRHFNPSQEIICRTCFFHSYGVTIVQ